MRIALCAALAASGCLDFDGLGALYHGDGAAADGPAADLADLAGSLTGAKRVFITNSTHSAREVNSAATADSICHTAGSKFVSPFRAWVSDDVSSPSGWPPVSARYVLLDGTPVAASRADFFSAQHQNGIVLTENMVAPSITMDPGQCSLNAVLVWTGTTPDGSLAPDDCSHWKSTTAVGSAGDANAIDASWSQRCTPGCTVSAHLYCVEQ